MSQAEQPQRLNPGHPVTVDDIRQLSGASTPHFAMQLRNRIAKLIRELPPTDPARVLGEQEVARLERLGFTGEIRGTQPQEGELPLRSVDDDAQPRKVPGAHPPYR